MMNTAMMMWTLWSSSPNINGSQAQNAWYGLCTDAGMEKPYEREIGFQRGTIFHALDKPFLGDEGAC